MAQADRQEVPGTPVLVDFVWIGTDCWVGFDEFRSQKCFEGRIPSSLVVHTWVGSGKLGWTEASCAHCVGKVRSWDGSWPLVSLERHGWRYHTLHRSGSRHYLQSEKGWANEE